MTLLRILPALLLSFALYTSVSQACEGEACSMKSTKCDGKSCKAAKCKDHASCKPENCDCASCKKHDHSSTTTPATTSGTTTAAATGATNYQVTMAEGEMHCGDCAKKVSAALQGLPDVDKGSVKVILWKKTATLQVKPGSKVTAEQIKKTIEEKTGYTVNSVETLTSTTTTTTKQ